MNKIVIACDSFKGSLTSAEANAACAAVLHRIWPDAEITEVAVADGGEGTGEALARAYDAHLVTMCVSDPAGHPVDAPFYISADRKTAIIDTASASGLTLLRPEELDPMAVSSYGTGQQIAAAIDMGCRHIILGLGGSATNDCGCGILQALGFRFLDSHGTPLGRGGVILPHIVSIDSSRRIQGLDRIRFSLYTDVDNPLFGPDGSAFTFAPQKGADEAQCHALDIGMRSFASVLSFCGYDDTSYDAGAGSAGGIRCGLSSILNADIYMGAPAILSAIDFEEIILDATLIITGEGHLDDTTLRGKTPFAIMQAARRYNIPVIAIGGQVSDAEALTDAGFSRIIETTPPGVPICEAMRPEVAATLLQKAIEKNLHD